MAHQQLQPQQHGMELLLYDDPHSEYTAKVSNTMQSGLQVPLHNMQLRRQGTAGASVFALIQRSDWLPLHLLSNSCISLLLCMLWQ
jgi:hypothetical protein